MTNSNGSWTPFLGHATLCTSDANGPAWKRLLNALNLVVFNEALSFDQSTCGLAGVTKQPGDMTSIPVALTPWRNHVNCLTNCCDANVPLTAGAGDGSLGGTWNCVYAFSGLGGDDNENDSELCIDTLAYTWVAVIFAASNGGIRCLYNPDSKGMLSFDDNGMATQPFSCNASPDWGGTSAQTAFQNILNPIVWMMNRVCACPSASGHTRQTAMCSGVGWCPTTQAVTRTNAMNYLTNCECPPGFSGADCSRTVASGCPYGTDGLVCTGHGVCDPNSPDHRCICNDGWDGVLCDIADCGADGKKGVCNGNGQCQRGTCICSDGFTGALCESPVAEKASSQPSQQQSVTQKHIAKWMYYVLGGMLLLIVAGIVYFVFVKTTNIPGLPEMSPMQSSSNT